METFLIIAFIYLLSVVISFILVYFGDYKYRRKCHTLYEFLFENDLYNGSCDSVFPHIVILVPGFNLLKGLINAGCGIICKIADWSKTINLKN